MRLFMNTPYLTGMFPHASGTGVSRNRSAHRSITWFVTAFHRKKRSLREGDIVNIDLTTIVDGFYGDSSETFMIGNVPEKARHVVMVSATALFLGIDAVKPGRTLRAIADAIEPYVESKGCSVVRQYTGHGIGKKFHEENFSVYHHIDREMRRHRHGTGHDVHDRTHDQPRRLGSDDR